MVGHCRNDDAKWSYLPRGCPACLSGPPTALGLMPVLLWAALLLPACASNDGAAAPGGEAQTRDHRGSRGGAAAWPGRRPVGGDHRGQGRLHRGGVRLRAAGRRAEHEYVAAGTATAYTRPAADRRRPFEPSGPTAPYRTRIVVRRTGRRREVQRHRRGRVAQRQRRRRRRSRWASTHEEIVRARRRVGRACRPSGSASRAGRCSSAAGVAGAEAPGQGPQGDRSRRATARSSTRATATRSTSTPRWPARSATARGLGGLAAAAADRAPASRSRRSRSSPTSTACSRSTHAFDGFFVHSRGAGGAAARRAGRVRRTSPASIGGTPTIFRTDQDVPVLDIQTETDVASVLSSYAARQPDNEHFRLWEVAGTAHADAAPGRRRAPKHVDCGVPINNGPMHIVAKAALRALDDLDHDRQGSAPRRRASR